MNSFRKKVQIHTCLSYPTTHTRQGPIAKHPRHEIVHRERATNNKPEAMVTGNKAPINRAKPTPPLCFRTSPIGEISTASSIWVRGAGLERGSNLMQRATKQMRAARGPHCRLGPRDPCSWAVAEGIMGI